MKPALSQDHSRYNGAEDDHRPPYKRDVDRIVHSKAYARYIDKTQVVYLVHNDHITHRGLHVQLVSNFSRGIAGILGLNQDLVEAIALGHDVGHPPFAHEGEEYLSKLSHSKGEGYFAHPWQSCRLFSIIEPLNLGLTVYDGFLCHDGGMQDCVAKSNPNKSWETHFEELELKKKNPDINLAPMTLEGCLVKLCDTMSYVGKDIEDAIQLGIIKREDVPVTCLGTTNRDILSVLAKDVIANSQGKNYIALSQEKYDALIILRNFNFENIYRHPSLKVESYKIEQGYRVLFERLVADHDENGENSHLYREYVKNKTYEASIERMAIDYISGMTDTYFVRVLQKLFIPAKITL